MDKVQKPRNPEFTFLVEWFPYRLLLYESLSQEPEYRILQLYSTYPHPSPLTSPREVLNASAALLLITDSARTSLS
jgi:hypothetical protein